MIGKTLLNLNGFFLDKATGNICYISQLNLEKTVKHFKLETYLPNFEFSQSTNTTNEANDWYKKERHTLERYCEIIT